MDSVKYADPMMLDGLNLYAYCGNNPVAKKQAIGSNNKFVFSSNYIIRKKSTNSKYESTVLESANNIRWFGSESRFSTGWNNSKLLANPVIRIGFSEYVTHTEGNRGVFYCFSGETKDVMSLLGNTPYVGVGLNLGNVFSYEMQFELFGISSQGNLGQLAVAAEFNLIGPISITIGWDTVLDNGDTQTKGFTFGINTGLIVGTLLWLYKLFALGDPSPLPVG